MNLHSITAPLNRPDSYPHDTPVLPDQNPALLRLARVGRTQLANTPTPLLPAPGLSARIASGVAVSVKADAWTGLGLGGNKVRKLEYELDPARLRGVTHLVTAGGPHSNHCRVTAAAAAHLGLGCTLVIDGEPEDEARGNPRLHRLLGARIVTVLDRAHRASGMDDEAVRIVAAGGKPLVIPVGASTPRGALGYIHSLNEMHDQHLALSDSPSSPPWIFTSSSSGGTLAGLILGCAILGWDARLVGVSPDEPAAVVRHAAIKIARRAARLLGNGEDGSPGGGAALARRVEATAASVRITDRFVGPGYGHPTTEAEEAIVLFGANAGVILDPVYTGKAAAALLAWIREGRVPTGAHAILLHTGGHPALFR